MWRKLRVNRRNGRPTKLQKRQQESQDEQEVLTESNAKAIDDTVAGDRSVAKEQPPQPINDSEEWYNQIQESPTKESISNSQVLKEPEDDQQSCKSSSEKQESGTNTNLLSLSGQALREEAYVQFDGEEADDYTGGPARFVLASDGVQSCAAVLMTFDLSLKIRESLHAQRAFTIAETRALHEEQANLDFELKLEHSIRKHEIRMMDLADLELDEANVEREALSDELEKLQLLLKNTRALRQQIKARMETQADNLRYIQGKVNAILEQTFVDARLIEPFLEPEEEPVPVLTVEEEYRKICQAIAEDNGLEEADIASFHSCSDHYEPPPLSPTTQARQVLHKDYFSAQRRLGEAQIAFDRRYDTREAEWYANYEAVERGEQAKDASVEDFDARWVVRIQEMTREVIEAEQAMTEAKRALVDAGIDLFQEDQESCFVDTADDGYLGDHEEKLVAQVPGEKIDGWLKEVPDRSSPMSVDGRDADEWDVGDVDIGDSASTIAEGADRRRIDKWRRICGL
ncbi:hypothetical protein KC331_g16273 [Hortaea werneckii]|nr:hypothetical protein KC331_g16273 [Hortaea werneckii]